MKLSPRAIAAVALILFHGPDRASASDVGALRKSKAGKSRKGKAGTVKSAKSSKDAGQGQCPGAADPAIPASAVYTMSNLDANSVVAFSRDAASGGLTYLTTVATGGAGGILDGSPLGIVPLDDPLASTDALIVTGNCLLAVNAGSNDVSSFRLGPGGAPALASRVPSGGEFPVSLAAREGLVYVLNAGLDGSIRGFDLTPYNCRLAPLAAGPTHLNLNTTLASGEAPFFAASPAQIGFTPDGGALVVTLKGDQNLPAPGSGAIRRFDLGEDGDVVDIQSFLVSDATVPFSFEYDARGNFLLVEAFGPNPPGTENGGTITTYSGVESGAGFEPALLQRAATAQTTTCWIRYSAKTSCAFTTNNGGDSVTAAKVGEDGGVVVVAEAEATLDAPIDISFSEDRRFLYALATNHDTSGQPTLYVYNAESCSCALVEIQTISNGLPAEGGGDFNGVVGLAIYQEQI